MLRRLLPWIALLPLVTSCATVRMARDPASLPTNGRAERVRTSRALDYSVATLIDAPPEIVWEVLTDASGYPRWNSTIVRLDGTIALGSRIRLVAHVAPKRTFKLKVSTLDSPRHMVWEDGGAMFLGVRNFTLAPSGAGTRFAMSETFSGGMLGMIAGKLPDFTNDFETFAADLKREAEARRDASTR